MITEIHKFNENTPEFFEKLDKLSENDRSIFINTLFFKRLNSSKDDDGKDFQFLNNQIRKNAQRRIDSLIKTVENSHDTYAQKRRPKDRTVPLNAN